MTEYMRAVFAICCVVSAASLLCRGRRDFVLRIAFSILVVYVALMPILSHLCSSEWSVRLDYEFDIGDYSEDYLAVAESAFTEGVKRLVTEKYGLKDEDVFVLCEGFDFEGMRADSIRIILSGAAAFADYKSIEKYIDTQQLGRCSVEIEIR
ncbi:MAG: hypothetical protein J6Q85_07260 [Clostridia bacterium]|nr:hypothetical protein [Clostridia bacterium]